MPRGGTWQGMGNVTAQSQEGVAEFDRRPWTSAIVLQGQVVTESDARSRNLSVPPNPNK